MYEELDYRQTSLGELILRRRRILKLDRDVVEVILNDEHLMSDMFTASEIALARLPLDRMATTAGCGRGRAACPCRRLGLGYTRPMRCLAMTLYRRSLLSNIWRR